MGTLLTLGLLTYLAASVNFSIILFKILGQGDPRDLFSGNAGTTNVSRQLGKLWGAVILLLDVGRAAAIAQIGVWFLPGPWVPILGLILVIGNQKPMFHGFRGGKGVAGYLGFTAFISPITAGVSCLTWVVVFGLFRVTFFGSFFMITVLGVGTMMRYVWDPLVIVTAGITMALIFWAHKTNIMAFQKGRMAGEKAEGL
ncbi:MAG: glycerol-3-phosphate acyltransferase [Deltaproteobacteria bacterium]|nr:glycerol-3-phosphate acyltransferase [Deltaproteobacteria bacterium]